METLTGIRPYLESGWQKTDKNTKATILFHQKKMMKMPKTNQDNCVHTYYS
jgi:hypothetical protein